MASPKSWWSEPVEIANKQTTPGEWLREAWLTLSDNEIARTLTNATGRKVNGGAVRDRRRRNNLIKTEGGIPVVFEDGGTKRYNKPPVITSDNVVVFADVHAPYHDAEWCSEVLYIANALGIKDCVISGDLFDFSALSGFSKFITINGEDDDISQEIESAGSFVDVLLGVFDNIVYTLGNHEKRLSRAAGVKIRTSLIRALLGKRLEKRLTIEPYYYAIIKSSDGQRWRITHPRNASVIPVRVAASLCNKFEMNVVAAHGHDWGETTSVSGRYAAACGCCSDIDKLDYVSLEDNTRPRMQNGAWLLVNGEPLLLHPKWRKPASVLRSCNVD